MRGVLAVGVTLALASACLAATGPGRLYGTYRAVVTPRALRAVGVPAQEAKFDAGTWTLVLHRQRWSMRQAGGLYGNAFAEGDLKVTGVRAQFILRRIDGVPHHEFAGAVTWRRHGSSILFAAAGIDQIFELDVVVAQPWRRVGG